MGGEETRGEEMNGREGNGKKQRRRVGVYVA